MAIPPTDGLLRANALRETVRQTDSRTYARWQPPYPRQRPVQQYDEIVQRVEPAGSRLIGTDGYPGKVFIHGPYMLLDKCR